VTELQGEAVIAALEGLQSSLDALIDRVDFIEFALVTGVALLFGVVVALVLERRAS